MFIIIRFAKQKICIGAIIFKTYVGVRSGAFMLLGGL